MLYIFCSDSGSKTKKPVAYGLWKIWITSEDFLYGFIVHTVTVFFESYAFFLFWLVCVHCAPFRMRWNRMSEYTEAFRRNTHLRHFNFFYVSDALLPDRYRPNICQLHRTHKPCFIIPEFRSVIFSQWHWINSGYQAISIAIHSERIIAALWCQLAHNNLRLVAPFAITKNSFTGHLNAPHREAVATNGGRN